MIRETRKYLLIVAALVCLTAWLSVPAAYFLSDSRAVFIAAVTAAAITTEVLIWIGALVGGWTVFEKRRKIWRRLTRGRQTEGA
ncbi:MAG: hypothetical protein QNJ40_10180 [Xanthomonadales bacterium]|nr:hypothetical protein [Xanthomonadales bacterium]